MDPIELYLRNVNVNFHLILISSDKICTLRTRLDNRSRKLSDNCTQTEFYQPSENGTSSKQVYL